MAEMDDLFKSLQLFSGAVKQYQTQQAVNDATKMMEELQSQALDEKQRLQANQQVGNALAMSLTGIGADAASVQAATQGLIMSPTAQATNIAQAEMQATGEAGQTARQQSSLSSAEGIQRRAEVGDTQRTRMNNETAIKVAEIGQQGRSTQKTAQISGRLLKEAKADFDKQAAKPLDSLKQIRIARATLNSDNPIGDKSVVNFLARASGEVGALTESDKAPFGGEQSLLGRILQTKENLESGKLTPENRKFIGDLINTYERAQSVNAQMVKNQITKRTANTAKLQGLEITPDEIGGVLIDDAELLPAPPPAPNSAAIQGAQAWVQQQLAKGMSPTDPKIQAVQAKIQKLQKGQ